ncbi:MAG: hypothetical protein JSW26_29275 [Desulfobacterales bacterium]|nr:MAG: hypothetical protein JSW26_29275 [Desulfobacterales bacterium]
MIYKPERRLFQPFKFDALDFLYRLKFNQNQTQAYFENQSLSFFDPNPEKAEKIFVKCKEITINTLNGNIPSVRQADREFSLDILRAVSYKFYCRAVGFGSEIYPETYGLSGKKWVSLSAKS